MQSYLPIHLYYSAIYCLLTVLANRFNFGVMRFLDQQLYQEMMNALRKGDILKFVIDTRSSGTQPRISLVFACQYCIVNCYPAMVCRGLGSLPRAQQCVTAPVDCRRSRIPYPRHSCTGCACCCSRGTHWVISISE